MTIDQFIISKTCLRDIQIEIYCRSLLVLTKALFETNYKSEAILLKMHIMTINNSLDSHVVKDDKYHITAWQMNKNQISILYKQRRAQCPRQVKHS